MEVFKKLFVLQRQKNSFIKLMLQINSLFRSVIKGQQNDIFINILSFSYPYHGGHLYQWINLFQSLLAGGKMPVLHQLFLVIKRPFQNQRNDLFRQASFQQLKRFYGKYPLIFVVANMKMRNTMLSVVNGDDDS